MHSRSSKGWCLILGASSGMGKGCVRTLSRQGMNIVGVHLDTAERQSEVDALIAEAKQLGVTARFFNVNAAGDAGIREVVDYISDACGEAGGISILIHSLAFGALLPFLPNASNPDSINRRQMDMTLSVMAHSLVYWVQALFEKNMLRSGAKVFALTSAGSSRVTAAYGAVSAAKCALESHVRQLALELAPSGIAVNALRAGVTLTPALERIPGHEDIVQRARRYNPHGRLTQPEDVADAIALLSGAQSSWITGNIIGVDGGENLTT